MVRLHTLPVCIYICCDVEEVVHLCSKGLLQLLTHYREGMQKTVYSVRCIEYTLHPWKWIYSHAQSILSHYRDHRRCSGY